MRGKARGIAEADTRAASMIEWWGDREQAGSAAAASPVSKKA